MRILERAAFLCAVSAIVLGLGTVVGAQSYGKPAEKPAVSEPADQPKETHPPGMLHKATMASLTATLVDAEKKAQEATATVKVTVAGVRLIDPALVNEKPRKGQGHLHYQVDDGPVIATTTTKLSFHGLKPGAHRIQVMLAANDHSMLGPQQVLEVTVPATATMR